MVDSWEVLVNVNKNYWLSLMIINVDKLILLWEVIYMMFLFVGFEIVVVFIKVYIV